MSWNSCCKCKVKMWIDDALNEAAIAARGEIPFYCSYGHRQFYLAGESEETKLRRERDHLKQDAARLEERANELLIESIRERARAEKAEKATKLLKKRSSAGTCPCCARTFSNMATHMKRQHPGFVKDGGANVVALKSQTFR
jgi:hypothetical protein